MNFVYLHWKLDSKNSSEEHVTYALKTNQHYFLKFKLSAPREEKKNL